MNDYTVDVLSTIPGPAGIQPTGVWVPSRIYRPTEAVVFNGNGYLCKRTNQGQQPDVSPTVWVLIVNRGSRGEKGDKGDIGLSIPGPAGPKGDKGDIGPAGPSGIVARGAWSPTAAYAGRDAVMYQGSMWVAQEANVNKPPAENTNIWWMMISKGDVGEKGDRGDGVAANFAEFRLDEDGNLVLDFYDPYGTVDPSNFVINEDGYLVIVSEE